MSSSGYTTGPQLMRWMKAVIWMSTGSQNPLTTSTVSMPKRMNITNAVGPNHFLAAAAGSAGRKWFGPTALVMIMLLGIDTELVVERKSTRLNSSHVAIS